MFRGKGWVRDLRWDHKVSHIPNVGSQIGGVGERISFDLSGDRADYRVCVLVALLQVTYITRRGVDASQQKYIIISLKNMGSG